MTRILSVDAGRLGPRILDQLAELGGAVAPVIVHQPTVALRPAPHHPGEISPHPGRGVDCQGHSPYGTTRSRRWVLALPPSPQPRTPP